MRRAACFVVFLCSTFLAGAVAAQERAAALSPANQTALDIYKRVISMRTAAGQGLVPKMASYLRDQFLAAGFPSGDIRIIPVGDTAALVARYRGDGTSGEKPILLMAHMDVVDALRKDWERDPFTLIEEDGYFFGRGASDNKFGVTMLTALFIKLKKEGFTPKRDLIIAFTGDEETDMATTRALAYDHKDLIDAAFALNSDAGGGLLSEDGKPLIYSVQVAEKTYATFELTTHNPGGHSSRPRKDNAIYDLAEAIKAVQNADFPVRWNDMTREYFSVNGKQTPGALGKAMLAFAKNPEDKQAQRTLRADPAYVGVLGTTCVATMLEGGHAENALPQSATLTVNCRIFPGVSVKDVEARLAKAVGEKGVDIKVIGEVVESPVSDLTDKLRGAIVKAVHGRHPGLPITPEVSSGGTDGMYYRQVGIPTYGVSAMFMKASDDYAHGLNERLPVDSFLHGLGHWEALIKELAG